MPITAKTVPKCCPSSPACYLAGPISALCGPGSCWETRCRAATTFDFWLRSLNVSHQLSFPGGNRPAALEFRALPERIEVGLRRFRTPGPIRKWLQWLWSMMRSGSRVICVERMPLTGQPVSKGGLFQASGCRVGGLQFTTIAELTLSRFVAPLDRKRFTITNCQSWRGASISRPRRGALDPVI